MLLVFEGHLNGEIFLRNDLPILLEDLPLEICNRMCFQQDGVPAHYSVDVRELFPKKWIE